MPVTVPFSKSTVFEICRQKMCRFRVNGRPIRRIFHRFQNVPASCERSLNDEKPREYFLAVLKFPYFIVIWTFSLLQKISKKVRKNEFLKMECRELSL